MGESQTVGPVPHLQLCRTGSQPNRNPPPPKPGLLASVNKKRMLSTPVPQSKTRCPFQATPKSFSERSERYRWKVKKNARRTEWRSGNRTAQVQNQNTPRQKRQEGQPFDGQSLESGHDSLSAFEQPCRSIYLTPSSRRSSGSMGPEQEPLPIRFMLPRQTPPKALHRSSQQPAYPG
jgi:hypothetical protein